LAVKAESVSRSLGLASRHYLSEGGPGLTCGKPRRHGWVVSEQLRSWLGVAEHLRNVQVGHREPIPHDVPAPGMQGCFENAEWMPQG
jgi:hypothetical protein